MINVLIAEDDSSISEMVECVLLANGYSVCGIAATVEEAVALGRQHRPDLAILDMHLAEGGLGTAIAAQLCPFGKLGVLFATADPGRVTAMATHGHACLTKPYRWADLLRALEIVREIAITGRASPPFPRGFQLLRRWATIGQKTMDAPSVARLPCGSCGTVGE